MVPDDVTGTWNRTEGPVSLGTGPLETQGTSPLDMQWTAVLMLHKSGRGVGRVFTIGTNMNPTTGSGIVVRTWNDAPISRRDCDGYADATAMCQANGKAWSNYRQLDRTTDYLQALADATGLAPDQLVISTTTGPNHLRGTWIHPRLAVDLARWLSPAFAVWMDGWFLEQTQRPQPPATPKPLPAVEQPRMVIPKGAHGLVLASLADFEDALFARINAIADRAQQLQPRHHRPLITVHDLPPSGAAVIQLIHRLRDLGRRVRTQDVWKPLAPRWAHHTVCNQLTTLNRHGLIAKRGTGWHLTDAGMRLIKAGAAAESAA